MAAFARGCSVTPRSMGLRVLDNGHSTATHRERRSALLRLAVFSSGGSKITALALQGLAIPLVYRALGGHQYALYVLLSGVLATISLLQMGAGPGLTRELAQAHAAENRERESALFCGAVIFSACAALLGAAAVSTAVHVMPSQLFFGAVFASDRAEILHVTDICALLLAAHIVLGVVDSALAGYQEQVFTGVSTGLTNIITTVVLCVICFGVPSITAVVLTLYGLPACSRLINLAWLLHRRPHLMTCFATPREWPIRLMMHTGLGFWMIQVGGLLEQNSGPFLLAHLSTPHAVDIFAVAFKICGFAGSVAGTVTQPLWPSFTDAIARHDLDWVLRVFRRVRQGVVSTSSLLALGMVISGSWFFTHILHASVGPERLLVVILAVYLVANMWTHLYYVTLMGISNIWRVAGVVLAENCLMVIGGAILVPRFGASGMAMGYLLASVLLPAWLLRRMFIRVCATLARSSASAQSPAHEMG